MHHLKITDETYSINLSEHYNVSIQAMPDGFSFIVHDHIRNKFVAVEHIPCEYDFLSNEYRQAFSAFLEQLEILSRPVREKKALVFSSSYMLVPGPLFDPAVAEDYLKFQFGHTEKVQAFKFWLPETPVLAYSLDSDIFVRLTSKGFDKIFCHVVPNIGQILRLGTKSTTDSVVSVRISGKYADILVYRGKYLLFANNLKFLSPDDLSYFIMLTYQELGLDIKTIPLEISGLIEKDSDMLNLVSSYIQTTNFATPPSDFISSYRFNEMPKYWFPQLMEACHANY